MDIIEIELLRLWVLFFFVNALSLFLYFATLTASQWEAQFLVCLLTQSDMTNFVFDAWYHLFNLMMICISISISISTSISCAIGRHCCSLVAFFLLFCPQQLIITWLLFLDFIYLYFCFYLCIIWLCLPFINILYIWCMCNIMEQHVERSTLILVSLELIHYCIFVMIEKSWEISRIILNFEYEILKNNFLIYFASPHSHTHLCCDWSRVWLTCSGILQKFKCFSEWFIVG